MTEVGELFIILGLATLAAVLALHIFDTLMDIKHGRDSHEHPDIQE